MRHDLELDLYWLLPHKYSFRSPIKVPVLLLAVLTMADRIGEPASSLLFFFS